MLSEKKSIFSDFCFFIKSKLSCSPYFTMENRKRWTLLISGVIDRQNAYRYIERNYHDDPVS